MPHPDPVQYRALTPAVLAFLSGLPLTALLTACACIFPGADCDPEAPLVTNATAGSIRVFYNAGEESSTVLTIEPGDTRTLSAGVVDGCWAIDAPLIAKDEDGRELARRSAPLCFPDEWVIDRPS